jgi:ribosome-associated toxin RatA of RatAB toxin-antitoxin module
MKKWWIGLGALLALGVASPAVAQRKPAIQEVEASDGVKGLKASFQVDQPRDVVFALLDDLDAFPRIFPNVVQVKVLKQEGDTREVYFKVDAVLSEAEYVLRRSSRRGPKRDSITWDLVRGDPTVVRGSWTLIDGDKPGTTKLLYQSYVDVAAVVPTSMVRDIAIGKVEDMADRIREHARARAQAKAEAR